MQLEDKYILQDCLATLKHQAIVDTWASFECQKDDLRRLLQNISTDKNDLRNAVFNLMSQMGLYQVTAVAPSEIKQSADKWRSALEQMPTQ